MLTSLRGSLVVLLLLVATGCAPQKPPALQNASASTTPTAATSSVSSIDAQTVQKVIAATRPLVVRIETSRCSNEDSGIGTGFLIDARHVVTLAHVVSQARVSASPGWADIAVRTVDRGVVKARVIGIDEEADLALLELKEALATKAGPTGLVLSTAKVAVGDPIVSLGYPEGRPLTSFEAHVAGLNKSMTIENRDLTGLVQYDASVAGSSGGPLLLADGSVVGMSETGIKATPVQNYAVTSFAATVTRWLASPVPQQTPTCPSGVDGLVQSSHAEATGIARAISGWLMSGKGYDYLSGRELNRVGSRAQYEAATAGVTRSNLVVPPAVSWATETADSAEAIYAETTAAGCVVLHKKLVMSTALGAWTVSEVADAEAAKPC